MSETDAGSTPRSRALASQWPTLLFMVVLWGAVWQDFAPHVLLTGAVLSVLIMWVFPLPPIPFPGRFHPWHALVFTARFLWAVVRASVQVAGVVLLRPRASRHSIVEMRLRSHDDMVLTLTSHALALVPGSIVLDVDRVTATLYLHCLDVADDESIERVKRQALATEAGIIRAIGSHEDMELLRRHPDSAPPFDQIADYRQHPPHVHPAPPPSSGEDRAEGRRARPEDEEERG